MLEKNISRRELLRVIGLGAAGVTIAACAPPEKVVEEEVVEEEVVEEEVEVEEEEAEPAPKEKVRLRFMSRTGAEYIGEYEQAIEEDFRSAHPNIEVDVEPAPEGWTDKLLAQMVAGEAVDLFQAWGNIFFNWTERGLLLDCQPFVDRDMTQEEIDDYNEFQWEGLMMRGVRVGMPKYINIMTVQINKDMFDKYGVDYPPEDGDWDHDDYENMARELTEAARSEGDENFWGGYIPQWSWDRFWYRIDMFGGAVVNEKYGKTCLLDSEESQEALKWMYDMEWTNNWIAQPAQVEDKNFREAMNAEFIAMAEDGTYPKSTDDIYEGGPAENWDMYHVPVGPAGIRKVLGTTDAWSITKQTDHPEESWELLHFLSGPVFQERCIVKVNGIIPVLNSLIGTFIDTVRSVKPNLENVRLETIEEALEWGYPEDTFWFDDQVCAQEIIVPALEKVFQVGDVGAEYFIEVAEEVNECQSE